MSQELDAERQHNRSNENDSEQCRAGQGVAAGGRYLLFKLVLSVWQILQRYPIILAAGPRMRRCTVVRAFAYDEKAYRGADDGQEGEVSWSVGID